MVKNQFERKVPELLVPAGGMRELFAAVENGADAVYLGGRLFNARKNAKNFSNEELEKTIRFAHARDVKIYLTINTLMYDSEILQALEYAKYLYEIGVDALIIQDLGFARLVKKQIQDFEIHLSTQASVYNLDGVLKAQEIGFSRVVLARENTLAQIKAITDSTDVEIEVFVHGAICICYSGQCQFSNNIGNRSGNRGECAQPCRMKFTAASKSTHVLSPKDLSCIEYLKEIAEAGVSSIKIEGRMKSAEYVAVVCRLYRKYLDIYKEKGEYKVSTEDMISLAQIFNRGNFTSGYFFGNQGEEFMSKKIAKHQGIYIGKAISKVSDTLVDVRLETGKTLNMGDGVEFANDELAGNVLSYVKELGNGCFRIGDIRKNVRKGDALYKISDKRQLLDAAESVLRVENGKAFRKSKVDMAILIHKGVPAILRIESANKAIEVTGTRKSEEAQNHPLTVEAVKKQLSKLGTTAFEMADFSCELDENVSLPISELNDLRRRAVEKLEELKIGRRTLPKSGEQQMNPKESKDAESKKLLGGLSSDVSELYFHEFNSTLVEEYIKTFKSVIRNSEISSLSFVFSVWDLLENGAQIDKFMEKIYHNMGSDEIEIIKIPYIFPITAGKHDDYIKANVLKIIELAKLNGIYIGNLGAVNLFAGQALRLFADYGMNIINEQAALCAYDMGFSEVFTGHEINYNVFGKVPLMISEHHFSEKEITDRKQQKYQIDWLFQFEKSVIYEKTDILQTVNNIHNYHNFRIYL